MKTILIRGGRVIDPGRRLDMTGDMLVRGGRIAGLGKDLDMVARGADIVISAAGAIVCPGFIDLHVHLREPGFEKKETIATGTQAAARGGFTSVCCMPNTRPSLDSASRIERVKWIAARDGLVRVFPIGTITLGQQGRDLVVFKDLADAGAVAVSEDGRSVVDADLLRKAMSICQALELPISDHCEDPTLSKNGVMNEGDKAAQLGLMGIPAQAETAMMKRDIELAAATGASLHIAHVSTAGSVALLREASKAGIRVTAEVTPHHLSLTEDMINGENANLKMNPPLRTERDRQALLQAVDEGLISAIATDHAPHSAVDKAGGFENAAFGISGLETALGVLLGLVHRGELALLKLVERLTYGPAHVFPALRTLGSLETGSPADITVFDAGTEWIVDAGGLASMGRNNPWLGEVLRGKVLVTMVAGNVAYVDEKVHAWEGPRCSPVSGKQLMQSTEIPW